MNKRGLISTILVICIAFSLLSAAYANPAETVQEKADVLNTLSLLKGDGSGDYNLEGQLKRSEAATFIVRILGKETHVEANKKNYWSTPFSDVISTQWYAPYVGYCVKQGIINGMDDGDFHPEETVTEKAFLKMVLGVLGYKYGSDFTWDNVYKTAYNVELVDNRSYLLRSADNDEYKRAEVVEVLYSALTKEMKDTKKTLIEWLVDEGAVSSELAVDEGFIEEEEVDELPTEIEEVRVLGPASISITFNEQIDDVDDDDIVIYETKDFTKRLTVSIEDRSKDEIILNTSMQVPEREYTIEIYNVTDMYGNVSKTLFETFEGHDEVEVDSDFFRIKKIEPVNKSTVNVYFTHPVIDNSDYVKYYKIYKDKKTHCIGRQLFHGSKDTRLKLRWCGSELKRHGYGGKCFIYLENCRRPYKCIRHKVKRWGRGQHVLSCKGRRGRGF